MVKAVTPVMTSGSHRQAGCGEFTYQFDVSNQTGRTVTLIQRNGFSTTINPNMVHGKVTGELIIDVSTTSASNVVHNRTIHHLEATDANVKIFDEWQSEKVKGSNARSIVYHYKVTRQDIDNNESIYIDDLDLLVTTAPLGQIPPHPRSERAAMDRKLATEWSIRDTLNYTLYVIDNENRFGTQYISLGGEVFKVVGRPSIGLPSGVYISRSGADKSVATTRFTPGEGCPLRFYLSPEAASRYGDEAKRLEEEHRLALASIKLSEAQLLADNLNLKAAYEEKIRNSELDHREELKRLDRDKEDAVNEAKVLQAKIDQLTKASEAVLDQEAARRKAYYENENYQRKSAGETMKIVPMVLSLISTLLKPNK